MAWVDIATHPTAPSYRYSIVRCCISCCRTYLPPVLHARTVYQHISCPRIVCRLLKYTLQPHLAPQCHCGKLTRGRHRRMCLSRAYSQLPCCLPHLQPSRHQDGTDPTKEIQQAVRSGLNRVCNVIACGPALPRVEYVQRTLGYARK